MRSLRIASPHPATPEAAPEALPRHDHDHYGDPGDRPAPPGPAETILTAAIIAIGPVGLRLKTRFHHAGRPIGLGGCRGWRGAKFLSSGLGAAARACTPISRPLLARAGRDSRGQPRPEQRQPRFRLETISGPRPHARPDIAGPVCSGLGGQGEVVRSTTRCGQARVGNPHGRQPPRHALCSRPRPPSRLRPPLPRHYFRHGRALSAPSQPWRPGGPEGDVTATPRHAKLDDTLLGPATPRAATRSRCNADV